MENSLGKRLWTCDKTDCGINESLFLFLISNFRRVLNVVCFLLGNSPSSEFYMATFRNTLSVAFHRQVGWPMKMEYRDCSETSAYTIQTPGNYPEEIYDIIPVFYMAVALR